MSFNFEIAIYFRLLFELSLKSAQNAHELVILSLSLSLSLC